MPCRLDSECELLSLGVLTSEHVGTEHTCVRVKVWVQTAAKPVYEPRLMLKAILQKPEDPKELVRKWQSQLRTEQRALDRQVRGEGPTCIAHNAMHHFQACTAYLKDQGQLLQVLTYHNNQHGICTKPCSNQCSSSPIG